MKKKQVENLTVFTATRIPQKIWHAPFIKYVKLYTKTVKKMISRLYSTHKWKEK